MFLRNAGLILMGIGFISFLIGPNWLTLLGCIVGPILGIYGSFKHKKNE